MRYSAIMLPALAIAAPAAAQDGSETAEQRTVEGAQAFLVDYYRDVSAVGRVRIWAAMAVEGNPGSKNYVATGPWVLSNKAQPPGWRMDFLDGDLAALNSVERCKMSVRMAAPRTASFFPNSISRPLQAPLDGLTEDLDWSKIEKVTVEPAFRFDEEGNRVNTGQTAIVIGRKGLNFTFIHGAEDQARRAAFAMDFLREKCAPQYGQGF